ncbi:MAG: hypothetical protein ACI9K9_002223, partial [Neolewinella sp.]
PGDKSGALGWGFRQSRKMSGERLKPVVKDNA